MQAHPPSFVLDALSLGLTITLPTVVVVAHPDDETLGMAGTLALFQTLTIVQLTDGAPLDGVDARAQGFANRTAYAAAREREAQLALAQIGISCRRICHGVPDQESIFSALALTRAIQGELRRAKLVFTHPYEGGHPDHDTAALVVQTAGEGIARAGAVPPKRFEFASYHQRKGRMVTGSFWPAAGHAELTVRLREHVETAKRRALGAYRTQSHVIERFAPDVERYRTAPNYDFTQPPPPRTALYDHFGWRMTSQRWRDCAGAVAPSMELAAL
jgi:LmbE family N-acetylglucosaminyl deacetylase